MRHMAMRVVYAHPATHRTISNAGLTDTRLVKNATRFSWQQACYRVRAHGQVRDFLQIEEMAGTAAGRSLAHHCIQRVDQTRGLILRQEFG